MHVENPRYSLKTPSLRLCNLFSKRNFDTNFEISFAVTMDISLYAQFQKSKVGLGNSIFSLRVFWSSIFYLQNPYIMLQVYFVFYLFFLYMFQLPIKFIIITIAGNHLTRLAKTTLLLWHTQQPCFAASKFLVGQSTVVAVAQQILINSLFSQNKS